MPIAVNDLITMVQENIEDSSLNRRILPMLNIAQGYFANKYELPLLDATGQVTATKTAYKVALPADYMKGLWHVASAVQGQRIGVPDHGENNPNYGFPRFLKQFPMPSIDNVSAIKAVAVKGQELWYQGVADDTLQLHYFKNPTTLVEGANVLSLPDHLSEDLLVNYASWRMYGVIEDGIEGVKTDTAYYENLLAIAEEQLEAYCPKRGEPLYVTDDSDSIYD